MNRNESFHTIQLRDTNELHIKNISKFLNEFIEMKPIIKKSMNQTLKVNQAWQMNQRYKNYPNGLNEPSNPNQLGATRESLYGN